MVVSNVWKKENDGERCVRPCQHELNHVKPDILYD